MPCPYHPSAKSVSRCRDNACRTNANSLPSAGSRDLLCERAQERAFVVGTKPLLELSPRELARRLDNGALAMGPARLDRVQPRALARQTAHQQATPSPGLSTPIVALDPGPHGSADVPRGIVPDQHQHAAALSRQPPYARAPPWTCRSRQHGRSPETQVRFHDLILHSGAPISLLTTGGPIQGHSLPRIRTL